MAGQLQLEIVTPQQKLIDISVDSVTLPGTEGELGILPDHIPLLTTLHSGALIYRANDQKYSIAVHWGYAQVESNRVTILADVAEKGEDIDISRAQSAEKKAKDMLSQLSKDGVDASDQRLKHYEAKLKRSLVRQQVAMDQAFAAFLGS